MYIVIYLDSTGNYSGKARMLPKEQYERMKGMIRTGKLPIHIVDESKIETYPADLFTDKDVKKYLKPEKPEKPEKPKDENDVLKTKTKTK